MKNIRKVLAVTSIVSALTLGFSPAQATLASDSTSLLVAVEDSQKSDYVAGLRNLGCFLSFSREC